MAKKIEPIPFVGMVEVDDDEPKATDRNTFDKTQREVANELGVSRHAVSALEKKAMKKFKEKFIAKFDKDDFI